MVSMTRSPPCRYLAALPVPPSWFAGIGLDVHAIRPTRRGLARQCLDWTERTHHLAGPLGAHLLRQLCAAGWLQRSQASRAILVTPKGWQELRERLGVDETMVRDIATPER